MNPLLGQGFMILTLIISVPAEVLFLNWLRTLWQGSIRLDSPMLFALGMVFVFGMGGLTGLYLGATAPGIYLHDTIFVVCHFHPTTASASVLGSLAPSWIASPGGCAGRTSSRAGRCVRSWAATGSARPRSCPVPRRPGLGPWLRAADERAGGDHVDHSPPFWPLPQRRDRVDGD